MYKIKVLAELDSDEASLGFQMVAFSLCPQDGISFMHARMMSLPLFIRTPIIMDWGLTPCQCDLILYLQ